MKDRDLTPIQIQNIGRLSLDKKNRLYWDEELIHTEAILGFSVWQKRFVALFGFLATVGTVFNAAAAWTTFATRKPAVINVQPVIYLPAPVRPPSPQAPLSHTSTHKTLRPNKH